MMKPSVIIYFKPKWLVGSVSNKCSLMWCTYVMHFQEFQLGLAYLNYLCFFRDMATHPCSYGTFATLPIIHFNFYSNPKAIETKYFTTYGIAIVISVVNQDKKV